MSSSSRPAYEGDERRLVIALDIGTTYSGVSYCFLDPGMPPDIKTVQRYPGQSETGRHSKIPTIVVYGPNGDIRAVGAEAERESFKDKIEEENLVVAKWFKLHLRPRDSNSSQTFNHIPPIPLGKSAVRVLADFMEYLFHRAKDYIIETEAARGHNIWNAKRDIVLAHPNGWLGTQQDMMRRAAIIAGIIPDTDEGRESIRFVTEGEASLHYCVSKGIVPETLQNNSSVLVVDAGGGTIDISGYEKKSLTSTKIKFEETSIPQCHFHGSVFVTRNARQYLINFLSGSKYQDKASVDLVVECFDKSTKLTFRDINEPSFIRFGSVFDKDPKFNINMGKLKIEGTQVARFFQSSVDCITDAIRKAKDEEQVKFVFLVGGFAESDWLFNSIQQQFKGQDITICRPEQTPGKAVSDGAISFHLDHYVETRVSKYTYGTNCSTLFDLTDPEHLQRRSSVFRGLDGLPRLSGYFSIILPKNMKVSETQEFRKSFSTKRKSNRNFTIECKVLRYNGSTPQPRWIADESPSDWETMCTIEADSPMLSLIASRELSIVTGGIYYEIDFDIILLFGLTEFKAQIAWVEDGEEKRQVFYISSLINSNTTLYAVEEKANTQILFPSEEYK
ncbi:hypothetical protein AX16_004338 [Volvariella volvacea WC 439]|nr:hypothetical protein AX16_004338 [Volvariella volvacea WC 439]